MGKKSKRNSRQFIIIEMFLCLVMVVCGVLWYYYDSEIKKINDDYTSENKEYNEKNSELKKKEDELKKLEEDIESYNDLDKSIEKLKKDYFVKIKELEDKIISGESDKKIAYLTFDDGPYYNTYKVLDILDEYNVKATFFTTSINGDTCYDNKNANCFELYKEYLKHGHTIANHTYTHGIWKGLYKSVDSFMEALINQENHIKEQTGGYVTNITRFPGGSNTAGKLKNGIIEKLKERGYGWVDWTAGDGDGGELSSTTVAWSNFKGAINQDIEVVLFHDYSKITTAILPDAIEYLRDKGYILLPLFYESNMINK